MPGASPSNAILRFCRDPCGWRRKLRPATAMKSCSSSAEVSAPGSVRCPAAYLFFFLSHLATSKSFEQMAHFGFFRAQVRMRSFGNARLARNPLNHLDACACELADLLGVIGEQADLFCAELLQNLRGEAVVARVRGKAEIFIGFDRVHPTVLELVGAKLVHQSDAAAFLRQIEQHTRGRLANLP